MALQATSLTSSSSTSIHKEGKACPSMKESSFFGASLADHHKTDFSSLALKTKKVSRGGLKVQAVATITPGINRVSTEGNKTFRTGSVIVTGASSSLGLEAAKALAETGKWHVIMACRDFLKTERAAKSVGMSKGNYMHRHALGPRFVRQCQTICRQLQAK